MASIGLRSAIARARARRKRNRAKENAQRDYKKEYRRDQASVKRKKYRAGLNRRAHADGHYGNTPEGKDLIHENGHIVGLGDRSINRSKGAKQASLARIKARRRLT